MAAWEMMPEPSRVPCSGFQRDFKGDLEGLMRFITLGINIAPKFYVVWSLGPKALIYESLEPYRVRGSYYHRR